VTGQLLDDDGLHISAVVANCAMNRERQLVEVNSYTRELGFNPLVWLTARVGRQDRDWAGLGWLDLCCGTGRPLLQAAEHLAGAGLGEPVTLVGVDLVEFFDPIPQSAPAPHLVCASVTQWQPPRRFDLITYVHGLHYVGDKLGLLARAASWLTETGMFVADLDLASIRLSDGQPAGRRLATALRRAGVSYNQRRRRIACTGRRDIVLPYTYLGADDRAGPNYTGQPAVNSTYSERETHDGPADD
jgi:SAM-dependent methyltransferase